MRRFLPSIASAFLSAVITLTIAASVVAVVNFLMFWKALGAPLRDALLMEMELILHTLGDTAVLIGLICALVLLLWTVPVLRRRLQLPWIAAIAGSLCGLLVSPLWMFITIGISTTASSDTLTIIQNPEPFSWQLYFNGLPYICPIVILSGALFAFLHAFFTRRFLARKTWLATRAQ